jgi:hypothetical protein
MWKNYWPIYQQLEKEIMDLSFYITFCDAHLKVYSSKLSDILLRCCSECENAAKTLIDMNNFSTDKPSFPKCGDHLLSKYRTLNKTEVDITWLYQEFSNLKNVVIPFSTWASKNSKNPIWFDAYNSIKHNRNYNIHEGNLENVISALAGLFILNLLLRKGEIESHNEWIEITGKRIKSYSNFFSPKKFLELGNGGTYRTLKLTI